VEKSHLNWATQFLMVHVPLMFLSEWHEYPLVPWLAGEKNDHSLRLDVEIALPRLTCFLSASVTRKDLQFST
jgi:hypothetical protein